MTTERRGIKILDETGKEIGFIESPPFDSWQAWQAWLAVLIFFSFLVYLMVTYDP